MRKILGDKMYASYCKEQIVGSNKTININIAKISFCDIPLKTISHIRTYGNYGIGFSKEWAIRNQITPIMYVEKNSQLADQLIKSYTSVPASVADVHSELRQIDLQIQNSTSNKTTALNQTKQKIKNKFDPLFVATYINFFVKTYSGNLIRKGKKPILDYKFYDEREWCYFPKYNSRSGIQYTLNDAQYADWRGKTKKKQLIPGLNLIFSANDINHIIVNNEKDVASMINHIRQMKSFNSSEQEMLMTKIVTIKSIKDDF